MTLTAIFIGGGAGSVARALLGAGVNKLASSGNNLGPAMAPLGILAANVIATTFGRLRTSWSAYWLVWRWDGWYLRFGQNKLNEDGSHETDFYPCRNSHCGHELQR